MSDQILISPEEAAMFCMGDEAFEKASYERRILELERQLSEKERYTQAAFATIEKKHEEHIEQVRIEYARTSKEYDELAVENQRLRERVTNIKENKNKALSNAYYDLIEEKLEEAEKLDPIRLKTELENAKIMGVLLHRFSTGHTSVEQNNLICAMRGYLKAGLDADCGDDEFLELGYQKAMEELMEEHIRSIWQPHKTYVGAWTKDADPSLHPFRAVIPIKEDEEAPGLSSAEAAELITRQKEEELHGSYSALDGTEVRVTGAVTIPDGVYKMEPVPSVPAIPAIREWGDTDDVPF